ncbi:ESCRT-II complex subunit VPS36 [Entomortierella parvispora]|uniref:Vacuolar protein-sorting-associated protein 36 n=1 Tax=Entomortierella parvispora TaxID=205924 RepID=A0A9P3H7I1_9FUNG|nr:ESCRT-II complex subunit VPS36 [Entomortierella parvispora]
MDRWDPIELTSTFRPILEPLETIQTTQDQVGLYDGRLKAEDYPSGTVYLTGYRILYIDAKDPARKSIGLSLRLIQGIQHYGGFISSSPKITLDLYPRSTIVDPQSSSDLISTQGQQTLDNSFSGLAIKNEPSWVCAICYNSNQGGIQKCTICGVKRPIGESVANTPTTPAADPFLLNEPNYMDHPFGNAPQNAASNGGPDPTMAEATTGIACPACTFQNDPFMIQCEICGTELQDADSIAFMLHRQQQHQRSIRQLPSTINNGAISTSLPSTTAQGGNNSPSKSLGGSKLFSGFYGLSSGSSPSSGKSTSNDEANNSVKLSFRAGGIGHFHTLLKAAVAAKAWESKLKPKPLETSNSSSSDLTSTGPATPQIKIGGISNILRTVETNKKVTDETLSQAFQDLNGLMEKAAEMVTLAETISNRLAKSSSVDKEESATFKTYLLSMGIAAPVTKDTAGAVFHKELARELVEFILPIVEREGGTMSLMDIYCVFNRARGVELISPKDLHTACQLFPDLNLPLRLRKFDSGLLVIQTLARYSDDEVSTAVWKRIQGLPPGAGLTAIELASAVQISVALAQEQLLMTEARGRICRDESVEGIRFYDNLFTNWEL